MEDELDKLQQLPAQPISFEDIPTPEEHAREVRGIFITCVGIAVSLLLFAIGAVGFALGHGVPLQTLAFIVPIVMGVAIATFAIAYAIPVGLVSLKRLEIAYKMGYYGLSQNREVVASMKTIADRIQKETKPLPMGRRPSVEV